ncbi:MAG TPA: SUMF1/EgtB/PvdO family nonheme iron enzyme, partial [Candidatus Acidoferrum sp.]|nr:SUMF1/EgtB/PvdO family nonheme iron enzyme [Candidatus Acidoferrum sp.]
LATWSGFRLRDQSNRDQAVARRLAAASEQLGAGERARDATSAGRDEAMRDFDRSARDQGEARWRTVLATTSAAHDGFRAAARELEAALLIDARRADVRALMARVLFEDALLAEEDGDRSATAELLKRLEAYDDGSLLAEWRRPATLAVDAPGAVGIDVRPYVERDGHLELGTRVASGTGHALVTSLPAGSYRVDLRGRDGLVVPSPVLLGRGERIALTIPLPRASQIPDGFLYVPAGRFLTGSRTDEDFRRDFMSAPPMHAVSTGAYLIARHEVTFADWMTYLRALAPAEREERRPRPQTGWGTWSVRLDGDGPFALVIQRETGLARAHEGEPLVFQDRRSRRQVRWERLPVSGVAFDDARAYAAWLAAGGRVAGARLCTGLEWERAARGADGRRFPHGERLDPDDADIDITYDRKPLGLGPDEVGSHSRSNSPFGVADMVGNVWEWVPGPEDAVTFRGGSFYHGMISALSANREYGEPTQRSTWAGVRLCADPPAVQ